MPDGTWADVQGSYCCGGYDDDDDAACPYEKVEASKETKCCSKADSGACCLLELDKDNWWREGGMRGATAVYATDAGDVRVPVLWSGSLEDEESYYSADVAVFRAEACADEDAWSKKGSPSKDCAWVANSPEARCAAKGDAHYAFQSCPSACGTCGYDLSLIHI